MFLNYFPQFWYLKLKASLSYTFEAHVNWKTNLKSFLNSSLSLTKINVSATSGSRNIKPISNLLPPAELAKTFLAFKGASKLFFSFSFRYESEGDYHLNYGLDLQFFLIIK